MFRMRIFTTLAVLSLMAAGAHGQVVLSARSGLVYYVQGEVEINGSPARVNPPIDYPQLEAGQTLETGLGRAEVLLNSQAILWAGPETRLHFEDTSLEATWLVLEQGSIVIEVRDMLGAKVDVQVGGATAELLKNGVYRFDAASSDNPEPLPQSISTMDGELLVRHPDGTLALKGERRVDVSEGSSWEPVKFDKKAKEIRDGLYTWASFRSYHLDKENYQEGPRAWGFASRGRVKHNGFGIEYSTGETRASLEFVTRQQAGVLNYTQGRVLVNGQRARRRYDPLVPYLPAESLIETVEGKAEIFLTEGVTARMNPQTRLRLVDNRVESAVIHLEAGAAIIEVAEAGKNAGVRVVLGDPSTGIATTTLTKRGLYRFDTAAGTLHVWGGEALTSLNDRTMKTRSERVLDVMAMTDPVQFNKETYTDDLLDWTEDRSFALYSSLGDLMGDWRQSPFIAVATHDYFRDRSTGFRRRPF